MIEIAPNSTIYALACVGALLIGDDGFPVNIDLGCVTAPEDAAITCIVAGTRIDIRDLSAEIDIGEIVQVGTDFDPRTGRYARHFTRAIPGSTTLSFVAKRGAFDNQRATRAKFRLEITVGEHRFWVGQAYVSWSERSIEDMLAGTDDDQYIVLTLKPARDVTRSDMAEPGFAG